MTNLQLKVSASLKQALDKLKLSSENEEKKGKDIGRLSRYMTLIVTQMNEMLFFVVVSEVIISCNYVLVLNNLGNTFQCRE